MVKIFSDCLESKDSVEGDSAGRGHKPAGWTDTCIVTDMDCVTVKTGSWFDADQHSTLREVMVSIPFYAIVQCMTVANKYWASILKQAIIASFHIVPDLTFALAPYFDFL